MAGFDKSKDEVLISGVIESEDKKGGYAVKLCRYNKGEIKVQLQPYFVRDSDGEKSFVKLGRIKLTLWPRLVGAVEQLQDQLNKGANNNEETKGEKQEEEVSETIKDAFPTGEKKEGEFNAFEEPISPEEEDQKI